MKTPVARFRLLPLVASRRPRRGGGAGIAAVAPAGWLATLALLTVCATGCDRGETAIAPPRPVVPAGPGVLTGTVRLLGPVPKRQVLTTADCHTGGPPITDESVVADDAGRLKNVVVYVKDGPPIAAPAPTAVMDQVNCRFEPHVLAVRTGQVLRFRSSDPTLHNVHGLCEANPAFNLAMGSAGQSSDRTFARPEIFRVKCDVHPWMTGWVAVFDHPLFAVTGDHGAFEIKGLPPGAYTLVAWHERLGTREQAVTVPAQPAGAVKVEFRFGTAK